MHANLMLIAFGPTWRHVSSVFLSTLFRPFDDSTFWIRNNECFHREAHLIIHRKAIIDIL